MPDFPWGDNVLSAFGPRSAGAVWGGGAESKQLTERRSWQGQEDLSVVKQWPLSAPVMQPLYVSNPGPRPS